MKLEPNLSIAKELRKTVATGGHEGGHVETYSEILKSKECFMNWYTTFSGQQILWEDWVDQKTSQELRYIIDYMFNLSIAVSSASDEQLIYLRLAVKNDILKISQNLSDTAHKFFSRIDQRRLGYVGNGKLPLRVTYRRLSRTKLSKWMSENNLSLVDGKSFPLSRQSDATD